MYWQDRARRQAGVIARWQLVRAGLGHGPIDGLVARRDLTELLPGVYSPRPVPDSLAQRDWAAVLWSEGGLLSHRSAARLWHIPVEPTTVVHVTVADRRYRKPVPWVRLHRVPLARLHRTTVDGLPITDRERTVFDLLRTERFGVARDLLDRALRESWTDDAALAHEIREGRCRTGNRQLRILLSGIEPGAHAESERRLHVILRRAGLTGWTPQYHIRLPNGSAYADVAFPEQRVAIEVDGRRYHDEHSDAFEGDRLRQNEIVLLGWRVLRFTWAMLTQRPDYVLARIVQLLAA